MSDLAPKTEIGDQSVGEASVEALRKYGSRNWDFGLKELRPKNGVVFEIGCGNRIAAPGLMRYLWRKGFEGNYLGTDVGNWQADMQGDLFADLDKLVDGRGLDSRDPGLLDYWEKTGKVWTEFWRGKRENFSTKFGAEWDATKNSVWDQAKDFAEDEIGLILLRQPDVKGGDVFEKIMANMVEEATSSGVPMVVTSSNYGSVDLVYKFLAEGFREQDYEIKEDELWDERGRYASNFEFEKNGEHWVLTTGYYGTERSTGTRNEDQYVLLIQKIEEIAEDD